ncbi:nucleotidyltransferase domain-containing protein [Streptomyces sp. NPDC000229]|uniref:nucleotidyltransferase domain-containing protein n=1 Tax=Streptomyces sp. NPDC000229 TaxID=3154247 RepID=UPI00332FE461
MLNEDGTLAREVSLDRVPEAFVPVVDAARVRIGKTFGPARLHSAYLYGSVPRGTATPGVSDLDLLIALHEEPTDADRDAAAGMDAELDRRFPQIDGVGTLLFGAPTLLSERERYDLGFFVACLCTPLLGEDLAGRLPRYRPTSLLARETNGDLALLLPRWRQRAAGATTGAERARLGRWVGRHLVRTGFTLVMPRWGDWTSDLDEMTEAFAAHYPERAAQMRMAVAVGRDPAGADPAAFAVLVDGLGPWLAAEYEAVHGVKAPRP